MVKPIDDFPPPPPIPPFLRPDGDIEWGAPGLTKRELFAAMAMQGIASNPNAATIEGPDVVAGAAVEAADALLAELAKPKEDQ